VRDVEPRAADPGFQPGERGLLLGQPALQLGAGDRGQPAPARDGIARADLEIDRPGGDRVQRRAARRHHPAVRDDVAHQRAALDARGPDPGAIDRALRAEPPQHHISDPEQRREHERAAWQPAPPSPARCLGEHAVLRGGVRDHRMATCSNTHAHANP
jgi:hypothetical protein